MMELKMFEQWLFEASDYKYGDLETIFDDLVEYTKMVIAGKQPALLVTGSPGTGKSYLIQKQLDMAGLKEDTDYVIIKGKSSAAGMYMSLYEHNGKLIVYDDCDSIFKDDNSLLVLKGALDSSKVRKISWVVGKALKNANGENIPQKFIFTGRVIFITNMAQRKIDDAIKSRTLIIEIALSPLDMVKHINNKLKDIEPDEPIELKQLALNTIQGVAKKNKDVQVNLRTLVKAIAILKNEDSLKVARRMIIDQCSYE